MIVVKVELWSAVTGKKRKLAEMRISNDGTGTDAKSHYDGAIMRKPDFREVTREARVEDHRRHALTVWHLVAKMLKTMGYV
ncbi:hypothetical protein JYP52_21495 [Nitratireductor aquibiodomus]|uniref:hypothetical protein n=1 Tax=Nitratireductor TaxID=245876 RepID=UPI000DDEE9CC|nr:MULTISPECIES: hypothetical protein [Nitratireductor]MBN7763717.1 hypothetical protein [Nitratireductor aquibiodomus]